MNLISLFDIFTRGEKEYEESVPELSVSEDVDEKVDGAVEGQRDMAETSGEKGREWPVKLLAVSKT